MSTMDFIFDPAVMTTHKFTLYCTDQLSNLQGRMGPQTVTYMPQETFNRKTSIFLLSSISYIFFGWARVGPGVRPLHLQHPGRQLLVTEHLPGRPAGGQQVHAL
jgi:hypothetical protein